MTIRDWNQTQLTISVLGLVIAAFLAGIGSYVAFLQITDRVVVPRAKTGSSPSEAPRSITPIVGTYEWQWAGENWYGRITFAEDHTITQGKVGVIRKFYDSDGCAKFAIEDQVMKLVEGEFDQKHKDKVEIDMLVKKTVKGSQPEMEQRITGTLERRTCLVGQVKYHDHLTGKRYPGDMILVNYVSHLGSEEVETWFAGQY